MMLKYSKDSINYIIYFLISLNSHKRLLNLFKFQFIKNFI